MLVTAGCWHGGTADPRACPFPPVTLHLPQPQERSLGSAQGPTPLPAQGAASSTTTNAAHWGCPTPTPPRGWVNSTQALPHVPSGCKRPGPGAPAHPEKSCRAFRAPSLQGTGRGAASRGHGEWRSQSPNPPQTSDTQTHRGAGGHCEEKPTPPRAELTAPPLHRDHRPSPANPPQPLGLGCRGEGGSSPSKPRLRGQPPRLWGQLSRLQGQPPSLTPPAAPLPPHGGSPARARAA